MQRGRTSRRHLQRSCLPECRPTLVEGPAWAGRRGTEAQERRERSVAEEEEEGMPDTAGPPAADRIAARRVAQRSVWVAWLAAHREAAQVEGLLRAAGHHHLEMWEEVAGTTPLADRD